MAGPFDEIIAGLSGLLGLDQGGPMGAGSAAPGSNMPVDATQQTPQIAAPAPMTAPQPQMQSQQPSPGVFQPPSQGIMGNITQALWGPQGTASVYAATRNVDAQESRAISAIEARAAEIRAKNPGMTAAQITSTMVRDPVFAQNAAMIKPENHADLVTKIVGQTQPAAPKLINSGPGHVTQAFDPETGKQRGSSITTPTAEMQNQAYYLSLPAEKRALLDAQNVKPETAKIQAINAMLARGEISQELRDRLVGDVIKTTPIIDSYGQRTGSGVVDLSAAAGDKYPVLKPTSQPDPNAKTGVNPNQTPIPGSRTATPPTTTRPAPGEPGGDPVTPPGQAQPAPSMKGTQLLPRAVDMFNAAGLVGQAKSAVGSMVGNIPGKETAGEQEGIQLDAIRLMNGALTRELRQGDRFKSEVKALESVMPDTAGFWTNPVVAINKTIALRQSLETLRSQNMEAMGDASLASHTKKEASDKFAALNRALASMPGMDDLLVKREELRQGKGQTKANTLGEVIPTPGEVVDTAREVGKTVQKKVAPDTVDPKRVDYSKMSEEQLLQAGKEFNTLSKEAQDALMARARELKAKQGKR